MRKFGNKVLIGDLVIDKDASDLLEAVSNAEEDDLQEEEEKKPEGDGKAEDKTDGLTAD